MKVRYEFELERDSCADCIFCAFRMSSGYFCDTKEGKIIYRRSSQNDARLRLMDRPEWCPLQVVEDQLVIQKSDNK